MDIYNDDYLLGNAIEFGLEPENVAKEKMVGQTQRETFQKAVKAGVKMAFGTDAGVYPHGDNAKQFVTMVKFGMTPAQAIRTATQNSADLIGRSKDVGTIEVGKYADIIAVSGDPLQDVDGAAVGRLRDEGRHGLQGQAGRNGSGRVVGGWERPTQSNSRIVWSTCISRKDPRRWLRATGERARSPILKLLEHVAAEL